MNAHAAEEGQALAGSRATMLVLGSNAEEHARARHVHPVPAGAVTPVDHAAIALACGCESERAETHGAFDRALPRRSRSM